jgi:hypothetical protein
MYQIYNGYFIYTGGCQKFILILRDVVYIMCIHFFDTLYICANVNMNVPTSMYIVICEITTEERQNTTSQRDKSGTKIRRIYINFQDDTSDSSSQMDNSVSQVNN